MALDLGLSVPKISAGIVDHSFVADALESGADVLSDTQRCNRLSFATPLWLLRVWMLDGNLQAERDDETQRHAV